MRQEIRNAVAADPTLSSLLTGGVHATREIARSLTPSAFDANGEILVTLLVKMGSNLSSGPDDTAERRMVRFFAYQRRGYEEIESVVAALRQLFHRQKIADVDGVWEARWANDVLDQEDIVLECSLVVSNFEIVRHRG